MRMYSFWRDSLITMATNDAHYATSTKISHFIQTFKSLVGPVCHNSSVGSSRQCHDFVVRLHYSTSRQSSIPVVKSVHCNHNYLYFTIFNHYSSMQNWIRAPRFQFCCRGKLEETDVYCHHFWLIFFLNTWKHICIILPSMKVTFCRRRQSWAWVLP